MEELGLRPRNSFSGNTQMGFLLQCKFLPLANQKVGWGAGAGAGAALLPTRAAIRADKKRNTCGQKYGYL
jgi:hypothetical protein